MRFTDDYLFVSTQKKEAVQFIKLVSVHDTIVARNFDWDEPKMKKNCDVILVNFFGYVIVMTS